eukprot:Em0021g59a
MSLHDPLWDSMSLHDPLWDSLSLHDPLWDPMSPHDPLWDPMSPHDPLWDSMSFHDPLWDSMSLHDPLWDPCLHMIPYGTPCLPMIPYGTLCLHMIPYGTPCLPMIPYGTLCLPMIPYGTPCLSMIPYGTLWQALFTSTCQGSTVNQNVNYPLYNALYHPSSKNSSSSPGDGSASALLGVVLFMSLPKACHLYTVTVESGSWAYCTSQKPSLRDLKDFPIPVWLVFLVCVTYYVSVFPFIGMAVLFLQQKYGLSTSPANFVNRTPVGNCLWHNAVCAEPWASSGAHRSRIVVDSGGYMLTEVMFCALLCLALLCGIALYVYDATHGGKLNLSAWARAREAKKDEGVSRSRTSSFGSIRVPIKYTSPIPAASAFYLRKPLPVKMGEKIPEHVMVVNPLTTSYGVHAGILK